MAVAEIVDDAKWLAQLKRENARRLRLKALGASRFLIAKLDEIRERGQREHQDELRETRRRLARLVPLPR